MSSQVTFEVGDLVEWKDYLDGKELTGIVLDIGKFYLRVETNFHGQWNVHPASARKIAPARAHSNADPIETHMGDYIVVQLAKDTYRPATRPVIHQTRVAAETEAERLSREHNEYVFVVFKAVSFCRAETKSYTVRTDDE